MTETRTVPELPALLSSIWDRLEMSCDRIALPWSHPVLSTIGPAGPEARTVILRRLSSSRRELVAFTDGRSAKVNDLHADGRAVWTFYDPHDRWQLVAHSTIDVLNTGDFADRCWRESRPESLRCYLGPYAPGQRTLEPCFNTPLDLTPGAATHEELVAGRAHFVVLRATVHSLDWLELHSQGNLRARFTWEESQWMCDWVTP